MKMFHDLTGDHDVERLQVQVVQSFRISVEHGAEVVMRLEASDVLSGGIYTDDFRGHPDEAPVEPVRSGKMLLEVRVTYESEVEYPLSSRLVQYPGNPVFDKPTGESIWLHLSLPAPIWNARYATDHGLRDRIVTAAA